MFNFPLIPPRDFVPKMPSIGDKLLREKIEKIYDTVAVHNATPKTGSVVYCNLDIGAEHSGIYIGKGKIVHLNGDGNIEKVDAETFVSRLGGFNPAVTIYCPQNKNGEIMGFADAAKRARIEIGHTRDYNLAWNNCHTFTYYCLTGDTSLFDGTFTNLEFLLSNRYDFSKWRASGLGY